MNIFVRPAGTADLPAILAIYNRAVLTTTASYDFEPRSMEHRVAWFEDHQRAGLPVLVAVTETDDVIGWASLSRFHDRMGFRFTVENSLYVAEGFQGRGVGGRLLAALLACAQELRLRAVIAAIDADNAASLRLHAKFGFEQVGHFKQVGHKFDRWLDVIYLEKLI